MTTESSPLSLPVFDVARCNESTSNMEDISSDSDPETQRVLLAYREAQVAKKEKDAKREHSQQKLRKMKAAMADCGMTDAFLGLDALVKVQAAAAKASVSTAHVAFDETGGQAEVLDTTESRKTSKPSATTTCSEEMADASQEDSEDIMHLPIVSNLLKEYEAAMPNADPRTRDWLLLWGSPVYVWVLSVAYLFFVWAGPKVMANRRPLKLQSFLVIYNISLVALSLYMAIEMILSTYHAGYNYRCDGYTAEIAKNPGELRVAKVLWWYFFSKAIEFLDTLLMVVRKKNSQISFLHVYHHVSMLNIWWWVMIFIPGGLSWFGAWVNTVVHVVMYLYYGLSAIPSLRQHLWWKKYLTMFQLVQFVVNLTHSTAMLFTSCSFPLWGKLMLVGYMVSMLVLFSNFYIRAYMQPRHPASTTTATNGSTSMTYDKLSTANGAAVHVNGHTNGTTNVLAKRHISANTRETE